MTNYVKDDPTMKTKYDQISLNALDDINKRLDELVLKINGIVEEGVAPKASTPKSTKPLVNPERVISSLLRLRQEIVDQDPQLANPERREMYYKINSCLFDDYPSQRNKS